MTTTTTKKLGDLVRAKKDARPPDQSDWGSETPPTSGSTSASSAAPESATQTKGAAPAKSAARTKGAAAPTETASPAESATIDALPAYLQLERVQTRVDPEVMTTIRTAEVRLKAARRPGAVAGERLNTNTLIRAALRAVVDSGALETCSGTTEAELAASIRQQLQANV